MAKVPEKTNDGGPAFPQAVAEIQGLASTSNDFAMPGMSLRDHFAGLAMAACVGASSADNANYAANPAKAAEWAYQFADAMLKARSQG